MSGYQNNFIKGVHFFWIAQCPSFDCVKMILTPVENIVYKTSILSSTVGLRYCAAYFKLLFLWPFGSAPNYSIENDYRLQVCKTLLLPSKTVMNLHLCLKVSTGFQWNKELLTSYYYMFTKHWIVLHLCIYQLFKIVCS